MTRHAFTAADIAKGHRSRADRFSESYDAQKMRRQAEKALLNRVLAEAAMPEWYPHQ